jgi:hypothetical protein
MLMKVNLSSGHTYTWPCRSVHTECSFPRNIQHARSMVTYTLKCYACLSGCVLMCLRAGMLMEVDISSGHTYTWPCGAVHTV